MLFRIFRSVDHFDFTDLTIAESVALIRRVRTQTKDLKKMEFLPLLDALSAAVEASDGARLECLVFSREFWLLMQFGTDDACRETGFLQEMEQLLDRLESHGIDANIIRQMRVR